MLRPNKAGLLADLLAAAAALTWQHPACSSLSSQSWSRSQLPARYANKQTSRQAPRAWWGWTGLLDTAPMCSTWSSCRPVHGSCSLGSLIHVRLHYKAPTAAGVPHLLNTVQLQALHGGSPLRRSQQQSPGAHEAPRFASHAGWCRLRLVDGQGCWLHCKLQEGPARCGLAAWRQPCPSTFQQQPSGAHEAP